jgi:hypothetical protein
VYVFLIIHHYLALLPKINIGLELSSQSFDAAATVILSKRSASAPEAHEPMVQKEAVAVRLGGLRMNNSAQI